MPAPSRGGLRCVHTAVAMRSVGRVSEAFLLGDPSEEADTPGGLTTACSQLSSWFSARQQRSNLRSQRGPLCPLPRGLFNPTLDPQIITGSQGRAVGCCLTQRRPQPEQVISVRASQSFGFFETYLCVFPGQHHSGTPPEVGGHSELCRRGLTTCRSPQIRLRFPVLLPTSCAT